MVNAKQYLHPEDATALKSLESIPGFPTLVRKILSIGLEKLYYGINMASTIRLSETQLPELYNRLPPICEKLGIDVPEFYLEMNPVPNAGTFGDTRVFITITSGLVEMMNEEEIDAVLAHECGHIACHHVLYHSIARILISCADALGVLGNFSLPIQFALFYWERKSELSCDRAASIVTSPQTVTSVMARLAGGSKSITANVNMEEWAKQADEYEKIYNDGLWNKALQLSVIATLDHPFTAVRVREILKWGESDQYKNIINGVQNDCVCPNCKRTVGTYWNFCHYCGQKLK